MEKTEIGKKTNRSWRKKRFHCGLILFTTKSYHVSTRQAQPNKNKAMKAGAVRGLYKVTAGGQ